MGEARRINHLVTALKQSGFYANELPLPGRIDSNVRTALDMLKAYRDGDAKNLSRVVNAMRTIAPGIFRGFGANCQRVTPGLINAVDTFVVANTADQEHAVPVRPVEEDEKNSVYAG